ncbi:MORC family CW-type zinc finger protein 3 [Rhinophrynus dorsalis]
MAAQDTDGIRLSALCPKFLHTNSTSHTWPFSAVAELIDNAYDPDVNAKQIWIDKTLIKSHICLTFTDNGNGMSLDKLHKMLSFGFSDKVAVHGHVPVGLYGNGFKSGSMRLGKDTIVFTKNDSGMHVGMLSQSFLEAVKAEHVIVPIISFNKHNILLLIKTADSTANLNAILTHSFLKSERELLAELDAILGRKGTRIIIWNLRRDKRGCTEFDFDKDKYDIRIPDEVDDTGKRGYKKQERMDQIAPDSDFSLRAYCSILYLKPRMQIIIRGQKVQTQLVSKNLAYIEKDVYRPKFLAPKTIKITFGYNCRNKEHYGIMMYHKNRLIKAYVRVGCQLKANNMGVGVVGVIECNFLKPTHNKQDFDYTNEYRLTLTALGEKLNDYWNEMKVNKNTNPLSLPVEDTQKKPDQTWVQCDSCLKWRKLPDAMGKLPDKWYCSMNADPQFRDCSVPEEPEDDDEITHSTYEKTYKKRKTEQLLQAYEKPTILFTPPNKEIQPTLNSVPRFVKPNHTSGTVEMSAENSTTNDRYVMNYQSTMSLSERCKRPPLREDSSGSSKRLRMSESDTIELPDFSDSDAEDGDVIILEENSTPKPRSENLKQESNTDLSPVPPETLTKEPVRVTPTGAETSAASTQTERPTLTIKKENVSSNDIDFQSNKQVADSNVYSNCNGKGTHERDKGTERNIQKTPVNPADQEKEKLKKYCEELMQKVKVLENELTEVRNKQVKKEMSDMLTQTDADLLNASERPPRQLVVQYEHALKEINRLKAQCITLQRLKSEENMTPSKSAGEDSPSEVDDMAAQLDGVFRQLDACSTERDQYKNEVDQLKQKTTQLNSEKSQLETQIEQLKLMLQEMSKKDGASTSTTTAGSESMKLRTLRVNVAQLLTTLMPELDLQQINYDVDVIDDILAQVLEQADKLANGPE